MKDKILGALPKLSRKDLQQVVSIASSLLDKHSGIGTGNEMLWFDACTSVLNAKQPWSKASKTSTGRSFRSHADDAEAFLNSVINEKIKQRVGRAAARRFLIEILVADLKGRELTPTVGMLAANLPRLPEVFDGQHGFPGYRAAGMASMVFDRLLGGKP